jgi:hypothetical protein
MSIIIYLLMILTTVGCGGGGTKFARRSEETVETVSTNNSELGAIVEKNVQGYPTSRGAPLKWEEAWTDEFYKCSTREVCIFDIQLNEETVSNLEGIVNRDVLSALISNDSSHGKYWKSIYKATKNIFLKDPQTLSIVLTIFWKFRVQKPCAISSLIIVPFERDVENFHKFFFGSIKKDNLWLPIINVPQSLVQISESAPLSELLDA